MDTVTQSVGISRLLKPPLDASAPVCVFWDFENCHVPSDVDPDAIAVNIRAALLDYGLTGPLTICAYGNLALLPRRTQVGHNHLWNCERCHEGATPPLQLLLNTCVPQRRAWTIDPTRLSSSYCLPSWLLVVVLLLT